MPATLVKGLIDGDEITYRSHNTEAKDVRFSRRLRTVVFCDVVAPNSLRVDTLLGDLTLRSPRKLTVGSCALVQIEPVSVLEVFDDALSEEALLARLFSRHEIAVELPQAAIRERIKPSRINRRDLRDLLTITIDDDSSEDLDDALSCEFAANGDLRLFVHIADVASAVVAGSAIDAAAAAVPTSVYLPGHTRHMLPRHLAADTLSLIPNVDRHALTVEMLITQEGQQRSMDIYPSIINSNERLSYTTAAKLIQGLSHDAVDIAELVRMLHTAATRISIQRRARGGVDAWRVDAAEVNGRANNDEPAHELIERLMVQTNEAVATFLHSRAMPAVFRAHPALTKENVNELQDALPDAHVSHPLSPRAFSALAARYAHTQAESSFWDAALSVMPRARYQLDPLGHFGLGSDLYAHFTSPLRRYADLLTHRVLHAWFQGERAVDEVSMRSSVDVINTVSRRAEQVERDARRLGALLELDESISYEVVVIGSTKRDARVRFVGMDLTALISHAAHLRPGFRTTVTIAHLDPLAQKLELELPERFVKKARSKSARSRTGSGEAAAAPVVAATPSEKAAPTSHARTPKASSAPATAATSPATAASPAKKSSKKASSQQASSNKASSNKKSSNKKSSKTSKSSQTSETARQAKPARSKASRSTAARVEPAPAPLEPSERAPRSTKPAVKRASSKRTKSLAPDADKTPAVAAPAASSSVKAKFSRRRSKNSSQ